MSHGFFRHSEAQLFANTVTNSRARVALALVHQLILEVAGMHLLPERYSPNQNVDVLYFYKTIERLFTEWTEEVRNYPEAPGNRQRLLNIPEATALIPTLPTGRAWVALTNYLSILRNTPVPEGTLVDALFAPGFSLFSYPMLNCSIAYSTVMRVGRQSILGKEYLTKERKRGSEKVSGRSAYIYARTERKCKLTP